MGQLYTTPLTPPANLLTPGRCASRAAYNTTMSKLITEMDALVARLQDAREVDWFEGGGDPEWTSPAELPGGGWRPVAQATPVDFRGLAHALEVTVHPDAVTWYSRWWAGQLDAEADEGEVHLIQLWNPQDFESLVANLIGHALNKRRSKAEFSVFFATTEEDSELFLSIDNASGAVVLESPLDPPIREVAPDLATFLARLRAPG